MDANAEQVVAMNEEVFPGNTHAFAQLKDALTLGGITVLTGAGTSVPLYRTWLGVLNDMQGECEKRGLITSVADKEALKEQIAADPLEAASTIEGVFTPRIFRAQLAQIFKDKEECTEIHELVVALNPKAAITLNYDNGLETATVRVHRRLPKVVRAQDKSDVAKWMQGDLSDKQAAPIMHLHGVPSDPDAMVFTSEDYDKTYADPLHQNLVEQSWRSEKLLILGFGFTDPFLTRIAEHTLRSLTVDNRHFALIGRHEGSSVSSIMRSQFSKKFRCTPIFYQVKKDEHGGFHDHSELAVLLRILGKLTTSSGGIYSQQQSTAPVAQATTIQAASPSQIALRDFNKNLFVSPEGRTLYAEPKFLIPAPANSDLIEPPDFKYVSEIVLGTVNYMISAPSEFGGSTLARRLHMELTTAGKISYLRDASQLKAYKNKLFQEFPNAASGFDQNAILILDEFEPQSNERLVKEISGLEYFSRIILIFKPDAHSIVTDVSTTIGGRDFRILKLHHLDRHDIRTLATQMFNSADTDLMSAVVEKVYDDLLDLCIPLTPSNIIMYLTVLYREGDFYPLNRVQIMESYLQGLLRGPSDSYQESFTGQDKISIVASFAHHLHAMSASDFSEEIWTKFCKEYMEKALSRFNEKALLRELVRERVVTSWDNKYFFKYRFFFVYFLGRHVANRPAILRRMLDTEAHLSLPGLIEAISAIAVDNSTLISHLIGRVEATLVEFQAEYPLANRDPFETLEWPKGEQEEERVWRPLAEKIAAGPPPSEEIDLLKSSLMAEKRTANQTIVFEKFDSLERKLFRNAHGLIDALIGSEVADGDLKKRALQLILESYMIIYQIGLLFAPVIANNKYFVWNGILFHGSTRAPSSPEEAAKRALTVALGMAVNVATSLTRVLGSKRLGEVFKATREQDTSFKKLAIFTLLLRSKPMGWTDVAENMVRSTGKNSFYMRHMLIISSNQFFEEVNAGLERENIKRIITIIRIKREMKKNDPGSKLVGRVLSRLEKANAFDNQEETSDQTE